MAHRIALSLTLACGLLSSESLAQVPANDDCAGAQAITVGLTPFSSQMATDGSGLALDPLICDMGPFGDEQLYADVWFTFTAPNSSPYEFAVVSNGNPSFDSRIAVYTPSSCPDDPTTVIACDDDSGAGLEAYTMLPFLNAGTTYLIRAGSADSATVAQPAFLQANCSGALPGEFCSNPITINTFGSYFYYSDSIVDTLGVSLAGFCDFGQPGTDSQIYKDLFFELTAPVTGCYYISTVGTAGFDNRIAIYDGASCPGDPTMVLACSSSEIQPPVAPFEAGFDIDLVAGVTYVIRAGSTDMNQEGGATLIVAPGPQAVFNDAGLQPGAPGCGLPLPEMCSGDGGNQMGCTNCPCGNNALPGTIGGCLNRTGLPARLSQTGSTSVSLLPMHVIDLRFGATQLPPNTFSILVSGDVLAPQGMANPCFGMGTGAQSISFDGLRCAVQNLRRHGGRQADANGDIGVTTDPWGGEGGPPVGIAQAFGGFAAGQQRFFQAIYREEALAVCMRGLNTTQASGVTFTP